MAYEKDCDVLLKQLEKDVDRQIATAGSAVKSVAAERDLLRTAEKMRDLLSAALKGEKDDLDKVFGGSCERIGRLRIAIHSVTISPMHSKDLRWPNLRAIVETIEAVLKDLGSFRPWAPVTIQAPERIAYKGVRRRMSPGRRVHAKPEFEGGEPTSFEVEPALPGDLELSPTTGMISGVLRERVLVDEATYTVVGRNESGEVSVEIVFAVKEAPPGGVAYPGCPELPTKFRLGERVSLLPEVQGCPQEWKVHPELPSGLELDSETGEIRGIPTEPSSPKQYQVTASNSGGEVCTELCLEVLQAPPSELSFPDVPEKLFAGRPVQFLPSSQGSPPTDWTVDPPFPDGLTLDSANGAITGSASSTTPMLTYSVVAKNSAGSTYCEVSFAVELAPPEGLEYPAEELRLHRLKRASVKPTFVGVVQRFSISPALPEGLSFDVATGEISGMRSDLVEETEFQITARNVSGSARASAKLSVVVGPPSDLRYPAADPVIEVGEQVALAPTVDGGATSFAAEPALPEGMRLDTETGAIEGSPSAVSAETVYILTATNEAGSASSELTFSVVAPAPTDLAYPAACASYAVGEPMIIEPQLECWVEGTFEVDPALPEGLELDAASGVISGTPVAVCEEAIYSITARNSRGSGTVELAFQIIETVDSEAVAESIDKDLARRIEAVTDIDEMLPEPPRIKAFGDWMIWMVHRAYLDDPTLTDFDFNNIHMPPPHIEARIAPKLVKAMETNTHIHVLSLVNSNLMKSQGVELAASLEVNKTLRVLNLESNNLDSNAIKELALAIHKNPQSALEHLRLSPQKQVGVFFGRPVEEAVGAMMEKNNLVIRLGFECNDAHWRNIIDRALLRNNDFARRRRKRGGDEAEEETKVSEERQVSRLVLRLPPVASCTEVFADSSPAQNAFRGFIAQNKRFPNATQMQSFAKKMGVSLKYSEVAPTLKDCRGKMMDAAVGTEVTVADIFEADTEATLRKWSVNNENWELDIRTPDMKRYIYRSAKEPILLISAEWAAWLAAGVAA